MKKYLLDENLQYKIPQGWTVLKSQGQEIKLLTDKGPLQLNFHRLKKPSLKQTLVKAIGFKGRPLSILDITAGWAQDAFLLFLLGCRVKALESNPFVFHFVKKTLSLCGHNLSSNPFVFHFVKKTLSSHKKIQPMVQEEIPREEILREEILKGEIPRESVAGMDFPSSFETSCGNIQLIFGDSLTYLKNIQTQDRPEIIYMDPMFGERKTRQSQKSLRILKEIVGPTTNRQELFDLALKKALKRVVVKRHRLEPSMGKVQPQVFKGRSICYDVFRPDLSP